MEIQSLVGIAQEILDDRANFNVDLAVNGEADRDAMMALLSVGMSAGGARPKAVLAFNEDFTQVRSRQANVSEHRKDKETFGDPMGYGTMEYVYHLMAKLCGIDMMPTRLLDEGSQRHFITQRFDRRGNEKIHVQTLNGLAHVDFKMPGSYSYAELMQLAIKLKLSTLEAEQIFRRMVFNVVARNHDDHSKNFAFILGDGHKWKLSPAYDLAYSYRPGSPWVNSHWMSLNGKREGFSREDFFSFEKLSPIFTRKKIGLIVDETIEHVSTWRQLAKENGVPKALSEEIDKNLRLAI